MDDGTIAHPHPLLGRGADRQGPVLLEVNFGGDLNLAQLAHGAGALDDAYAEHLRRRGYQL